jgi:hypothetical protein
LVEEQSIAARVKRIAERVEGVRVIHVNVVPFVIED